jgi:hypothetical protein
MSQGMILVCSGFQVGFQAGTDMACFKAIGQEILNPVCKVLDDVIVILFWNHCPEFRFKV